MAKGLCGNCGIVLAPENAHLSVIKRGGGNCKLCRKICYDSRQDEIKAWRTQYSLKNKKRDSENNKVYHRRFDGRHKVLRRVLKKDGVPHTDSLWNFNFYCELIKDLKCHYCLGPLSETGGALDRIINSLKHTCDNVVPCCRRCNRIKGNDVSYEEMMILAPALREIDAKRHLMSLQKHSSDSSIQIDLHEKNDATADEAFCVLQST